MAKHTRATTTLTAAATKLFRQASNRSPTAGPSPPCPRGGQHTRSASQLAHDLLGMCVDCSLPAMDSPLARTSVPLSAQTSSQSEGAAFEETHHSRRMLVELPLCGGGEACFRPRRPGVDDQRDRTRATSPSSGEAATAARTSGLLARSARSRTPESAATGRSRSRDRAEDLLRFGRVEATPRRFRAAAPFVTDRPSRPPAARGPSWCACGHVVNARARAALLHGSSAPEEARVHTARRDRIDIGAAARGNRLAAARRP